MKKSLKILLAIIILLLICVLVFNSKKQGKDEKQEYGEKNVFNSNNEIKTALTLNDKIKNDTIWCGTFQLLWNDLKNNLAKQLESLLTATGKPNFSSSSSFKCTSFHEAIFIASYTIP